MIKQELKMQKCRTKICSEAATFRHVPETFVHVAIQNFILFETSVVLLRWNTSGYIYVNMVENREIMEICY